MTPEAFDRVLEKRIEGFGELFRMLSYQKIGTSTMQSRALGGVAGGTYLFALPGSTGAVKDAWDDILVWQLDARHRPCNLVELMPRLQEHLRAARVTVFAYLFLTALPRGPASSVLEQEGNGSMPDGAQFHRVEARPDASPRSTAPA